MLEKFQYDMFDHLEYPTIILSTKYHKHLGTINTVDQSSINPTFNLNSAQEISFSAYKKFSDIECNLWNDIIDGKYIYVPDYKEYYAIEVSIDSSDKTIKNVTGISACEYELSRRKLYNFECNTESDIARDDYEPTIIYNPDKLNASLLHRVLKDKCPDYSIAYVDESIAKLQRTFSADDKDIYSFLTDDVAKEVECIFIFDSVHRSISCYDLKTFGKNTDIYISNRNYSDSITVNGNPDEVFNCLKIEGGDDLITTTVANINPNGTNYIYNFSEDMLKDMPAELVEKIKSYNELYNDLQPTYQEYINKLYELIDEKINLESKMTPDVTTPETTAQQEAIKLVSQLTLVEVQKLNTLSKTSADLAVKGMAQVIVDPRYNVEVEYSTVTDYSTSLSYRTWTGKIRISNKGEKKFEDGSDDEALTNEFSVTIRSDDYEKYMYQKIQKALDRDDSVFYEIFEIENDEEFKNELTKYCLDRLESFESSYQTCLDILIEQGVTTDTKELYDVNLYEKMYQPYKTRIGYIQSEMVKREDEIASVQKEYDKYNKLREDIQVQLNFKNYIGNDLWIILSHYLQEDKYSNDNYISDGLTNDELIKRSKELFDKASEEVVKASENQYTFSSSLINLLNREDFKPFKDKIQLGNWINLGVDEDIYKLRLITISIDFGSLDKISVSFSNTEVLKNIVYDAKSVLDQAKSMGGSFNYVAHQASQGNEANHNVNSWIKDGLNSALVQIKNNDQEEITYDKHGLLCRSYDDIEDSYSPEQLKITHNCLVYTIDNWNTVSAALGKQQYVHYDESQNKFVTDIGFGLNSKFVQAGYIYGSQIIGGDIYSDNYSSPTATHIGLHDGSFSFAGGKLKYDNSELTVNGKIIATSGSFTGDIVATSIKASNGKIGNFNLSTALYSGTNSMSSTTAGIYLGTDGIQQYNNANQYVNIQNGILTCNGATVNGTIYCSNGTIGGFKITDSQIYNDNGDKSAGMGKYGSSWAFWAGATNTNSGNAPFNVGHSGELYASNATISGSFSCTNAGCTVKVTSGKLSFAYKSYTESYIQAVNTSSGGTQLDINCSDTLYLHGANGLQMYSNGNTLLLKCNNSKYLSCNSTWGGYIAGGLMVDSTIVVSSDKDKKHEISDLDINSTTSFIYSLIPKQFKYNNGTSNRLHHGFIAQEIKTSMGDDDWGVYVDDKDNGKGIRYEELISDIVLVIQEQKKIIDKLEQRIIELEAR